MGKQNEAYSWQNKKHSERANLRHAFIEDRETV